MKKEKVTKKDMFEMIREVVADNKDMVDFINHEIELIEKKAKSNSKTVNVDNENIAKLILEVLTEIGEIGATVTELLNTDALKNYTFTDSKITAITNQRVTSILRKLVDSQDVVRFEVKDKAFYSINTEK